MGRGKGKGKKQCINGNGNGNGGGDDLEENIPMIRRRGRPQKPHLKDDIIIIEEEVVKVEEEEIEGAKDVKKQAAADNVRKRKRTKVNPVSVKEEKSDGLKAVGFRHNGSRRKNKPHRAAEVGLECK